MNLPNVINFPKSRTFSTLETRMTGLQKLLRTRYRERARLLRELAKLEVDTSQTEATYDKNLKEYAERVGPENVEKCWLNYTKNIFIDATTGIIRYELQS